MELKNKKVLMMGLGILGGGVATAKWLLEQGANLTITDLKNEEYLKTSIKSLSKYRNKIKFLLGEHREKDFLENEIIVINPDVPSNNHFVEFARKNGKQIENELTLFYKFCPSKKIVAITGTRGKTTTTNWTYHLIKAQDPNTVLAGNSATNPFLEMIHGCNENSFVVVEVPSYHLELVGEENPKYAPRVSVITNVYQDHLSRHGSLENYARVKANIFKNQIQSDVLILNKDNKWTNYFLSLNPKAKVLFFSKHHDRDFGLKWGEHNLENLSAAILAAKSIGVTNDVIEKSLSTLPQVKFREEKIYEGGKLEIWNDTTATSPEAGIAAINRFSDKDNFILIAGGTDKELDFKQWAEAIKAKMESENLILLSGSATEKMKKVLDFEVVNEFATLKECLEKALAQSQTLGGKSAIVFSPGAKSFEKFKNEYDRGEQFNAIVKELM